MKTRNGSDERMPEQALSHQQAGLERPPEVFLSPNDAASLMSILGRRGDETLCSHSENGPHNGHNVTKRASEDATRTLSGSSDNRRMVSRPLLAPSPLRGDHPR